jgi:glucokinase
MTHIIAIDIGGTQMRAASYAAEGLTPCQLARTSTQRGKMGKGPIAPIERLYELIETIWPRGEQVDAISVAVPGPVNPFAGVLLEAPNIPGWEDMPLQKYLQERFHTPVMLGNDANLAALGEWKYGAGRGHHHMIYLTISTGIGSGIIVDDHLLLGDQGLAAEVGHVTVLPDGPVCGCGGRGHLEALASGTAIAHWVQEQIAQGTHSILATDQPISAKLVSDTAKKGDDLCISALARAGYYLGIAIANLLQTFNASAVILGGGVSKSGKLLFDPLDSSLKNHIMNAHYLDHLVLTAAAFGDEAGLIGALALGRSQVQ